MTQLIAPDSEVIILAGGFGTRLRSAVPDRPKPMALVAGRPFLEWQLDWLMQKGISRGILAVGYLHEQIVSHFGDNYRGMSLSYSVETTPLGTGGAILQALSICRSDWVFVTNGDTLSSFPLQQMWDSRTAAIDCLLAVCSVEDATRFGTVELDETSRLVIRFRSKGIGGRALINTGTYLIDRQSFINYNKLAVFSMESDYLEPQSAENKIGAVQGESLFIDIGIPADFERAQQFLPEAMAAVR